MVASAATQPLLTLSARPGMVRRMRRALVGDPLALFGLLLITGFILLAIFGPLLAPIAGRQGDGLIDVKHRLLAPSFTSDFFRPFGTDEFGYDILSRIMIGARSAFAVSFGVVIVAVLIGVPLGAIAGYRRGWVDGLIMRTTDLFLAFPPLLLAMAIVAALGPGLNNCAIALTVAWWPWYTRIARGTTVSLRELPFIDSARAIGLPDRSIILRHILPNAVTPIIVQATLDIGTVILAAGALAFIGLGAQPPSADWGLMVSDGRGYILKQWWVATFPGLAIFIATVGFNLVGDFLVRVLDPRQSS